MNPIHISGLSRVGKERTKGIAATTRREGYADQDFVQSNSKAIRAHSRFEATTSKSEASISSYQELNCKLGLIFFLASLGGLKGLGIQ